MFKTYSIHEGIRSMHSVWNLISNGRGAWPNQNSAGLQRNVEGAPELRYCVHRAMEGIQARANAEKSLGETDEKEASKWLSCSLSECSGQIVMFSTMVNPMTCPQELIFVTQSVKKVVQAVANQSGGKPECQLGEIGLVEECVASENKNIGWGSQTFEQQY